MAIVTDPDNLSQGAVDVTITDGIWSGKTGDTITIGSAGGFLPSLTAGDFFEVRLHSDAENNGLYQETGGTPSTTSVTADKLTGSPPINNAVGEAVTWLGDDGAAANELSVHFDTQGKEIWLIEQGNLSVDGVLLQVLYSFAKISWKDDDTLPPHDFPMVPIHPEQFELIEGWTFHDQITPTIRTRKLIRTGGWAEIDAAGETQREYMGAISLGDFEDAGADLGYYAPGSDATVDNTADFDFAGPINESLLVRFETGLDATGYDFNNDTPDTIDRNDAGSFIADGYVVGGRVIVRAANTVANDGTYEITVVTAAQMTVTAIGGGDAGLSVDLLDQTAILSYDYRTNLALFLRIRDADPNGKSFGKSDLAGIGVSTLTYQAYRFPLANVTDLKIAATDASIDGGGPWDQMSMKYFASPFSMDIDLLDTERAFGIVVDVGTHSGVDGSSATSITVTSAAGGIATSIYDGGTLTIHDGTDKGDHSIASTTATTIVLDSALTATESPLDFTIQRATPIVATAEEIYEFVQRELRKATDIDDLAATVIIGKTADETMRFVGETLEAGFASTALPANPNGGGTGVALLGFDSNDTNRLTFFDNTGASRTFPFVAAGTINFNPNLENDTGPAEYTMFYRETERFTNVGFGLSAFSLDTATLDSSVTNLTTELADGDYIKLTGFTNADLDGIYVLTGTPAGGGPYTATVRRVDGSTLANEAEGASVNLDKKPLGSPDAVIVDNNAGVDVKGTIGAPSVGFDFDYDGNVQGGRDAATPANIVIRAIGLDLGQFVETEGIITRAVGLSYSLVAALERNYSNP